MNVVNLSDYRNKTQAHCPVCLEVHRSKRMIEPTTLFLCDEHYREDYVVVIKGDVKIDNEKGTISLQRKKTYFYIDKYSYFDVFDDFENNSASELNFTFIEDELFQQLVDYWS